MKVYLHELDSKLPTIEIWFENEKDVNDMREILDGFLKNGVGPYIVYEEISTGQQPVIKWKYSGKTEWKLKEVNAIQ